MSHTMRNTTICMWENKGADQLRGNHEADQRLCFRYTDSTFLFFLNPKFQISRLLLSLYCSVCVGPVRKQHCWFSHVAVHMLDMPNNRQIHVLILVELFSQGVKQQVWSR